MWMTLLRVIPHMSNCASLRMAGVVSCYKCQSSVITLSAAKLSWNTCPTTSPQWHLAAVPGSDLLGWIRMFWHPIWHSIWHLFWHFVWLAAMWPDILTGHCSDILLGICSGILSGIHSDILPGKNSSTHSGIQFGICSDILPVHGIYSGIHSRLCSDILFWHMFWHTFWKYVLTFSLA